MKAISTFFKKLSFGQILSQILTVFMAGVLLFTSTACNAGDVRGARPDNPPVQVGGMNNPHKAGGDGYTNYKMSPDPKVKSQNGHAALPVAGDRLMASNQESNSSRLLYPGSGPAETDRYDRELGGNQALLDETGPHPNQRQPIVDRSDPNAQILERVGAAVKDASAFLKDSSEEAAQSGATKGNPLQR